MQSCVGEVCEDQWCLSADEHQMLQTTCSNRGTTDGVVNSCNEEAVSLDSNAALLNNKARSNRQGSEAITGVT